MHKIKILTFVGSREVMVRTRELDHDKIQFKVSKLS